MIRLRKKKSKLKKKKVAIKNNSRNNWRRTSKLTIKSKLTIRDKKNYLKKKLENQNLPNMNANAKRLHF